jgi:hypothetical protein
MIDGDHQFFAGKSLAELAREQGVGPVKDISVFAGGIPDDEDVDEMIAEIYRLRAPSVCRRYEAATNLNPKGISPPRSERRTKGKSRCSTDEKL